MNQMCKQSRYNLWLKDPNETEHYIFNTLYKSSIAVSSTEVSEIKAFLKSLERNNPYFIPLLKQRVIIPIETNEKKIIANRKKRGILDENRLDLILMPTLDCNFDCGYCFESRICSALDENSELKIKKFLKKQIPEYPVVIIHWFGGEPLLQKEKVISLSEYAKRIGYESKTKIFFHITTNGYLLNSKLIHKLDEIGCTHYQITLDGTGKYHNKLRPLKNGRGTFRRIYNNAIEILNITNSKQTTIGLRINFNITNKDSIPELLYSFPKKFRERLKVSIVPIFGDSKYRALESMTIEEIESTIASNLNLAEQLNYKVISDGSLVDGVRLVNCYAERKNEYIINYNTEVYKCSGEDFLHAPPVGRISDDGEIEKFPTWKEWESLPLWDEKCEDCVFLPLCLGGCHSKRLRRGRKGDFCTILSKEQILNELKRKNVNLRSNLQKGGDCDEEHYKTQKRRRNSSFNKEKSY